MLSYGSRRSQSYKTLHYVTLHKEHKKFFCRIADGELNPLDLGQPTTDNTQQTNNKSQLRANNKQYTKKGRERRSNKHQTENNGQ